jgi:hypothetical protein
VLAGCAPSLFLASSCFFFNSFESFTGLACGRL